MVRRLLSGLALLAMWLVVGPARAATPVDFDTTCADEARRTVVETRFDAGDVRLDLSRSAAELTAMKSIGGRWRTSGLTTMTQQIGIRTWTRVLQAPDGRGCALPRLELTVIVAPQQVYVGREFARGSCSFDEIVAHEMRHVQANREHAARVVRSFEIRLRAAFSDRPLQGDPATLHAEVMRTLEVDWLPRLKAALEQVDPRQPVIDSEGESDRLSHACDGEIAAILSTRAER
jgi:hypothetical protein